MAEALRSDIGVGCFQKPVCGDEPGKVSRPQLSSSGVTTEENNQREQKNTGAITEAQQIRL